MSNKSPNLVTLRFTTTTATAGSSSSRQCVISEFLPRSTKKLDRFCLIMSFYKNDVPFFVFDGEAFSQWYYVMNLLLLKWSIRNRIPLQVKDAVKITENTSFLELQRWQRYKCYGWIHQSLSNQCHQRAIGIGKCQQVEVPVQLRSQKFVRNVPNVRVCVNRNQEEPNSLYTQVHFHSLTHSRYLIGFVNGSRPLVL